MPVNFILDKIKFNKLVNRISLISVFIPQHFSLEQLDPGNVMLINHISNTGTWLDVHNIVVISRKNNFIIEHLPFDLIFIRHLIN